MSNLQMRDTVSFVFEPTVMISEQFWILGIEEPM